MKILLIASFAESVVDFRGRLIEAMRSAGAEVHVVAPGLGLGSAPRRELEKAGVICHDIALARTGMNPILDLWYAVRLFACMRRVRPDLTLAYTVKPVVYGGMVARLAGVPRRIVLITGLGYAFVGPGGLVSRIVRTLYRRSLASAGHVFFQNPDDQRLFVEEGLLRTGTPTSVVNGSGIDLQDYAASPVPAGPPVFLMIARLIRAKGVREYAAAAAAARKAFPTARFQLAGWIDDNPDSISADELKAWTESGNIEFLGKLDDVRPALAAASVYVLPSWREGTPRTVLEAMATGRAIITTDAPGCRETVSEGVNGFMVPVSAADRLAEAMLRFLRDPGLAAAMGPRSRRMAEEKYDVDKVNDAMLTAMGVRDGSRNQ